MTKLPHLEELVLYWPTEYFFVTQPYGANPDYYKQFGLTGHDGFDARAPLGSKIFACCDGFVLRVGYWGAYGRQIRIETIMDNGQVIEHIYAHLETTKVKEGQKVWASQRIGTANNTGNSYGSHLHLSLKLRGATERGLTDQPYDLIDPTPYMVEEYAPRKRVYVPERSWREYVD